MGERVDECRRRVGRVGSVPRETVDDAIAEAHHAFKAWGAAESGIEAVAGAEELQRPVRAWQDACAGGWRYVPHRRA